MLRILHLCAALLVAGGLSVAPGIVRAAESYDNCTGFIDSVPTTISTQGVWCLRHNLGTNITSGNAVTIATNNVTIDCNDFKIGGLAAGDGSGATGIRADYRQNATVRHCNVRGFNYGIRLIGGAGHLVEDNRLDNNLYMGIHVTGDNNLVQRNRVYDTGGLAGLGFSYGIFASANLVGNTVSGLFANLSGGTLTGITANGRATQVRGNRVSGFDMTAADGGAVSSARGIRLMGNYQRAAGNQVIGGDLASGYGIYAEFHASYCLNNSVGGFIADIDPKCAGSGNLIAP